MHHKIIITGGTGFIASALIPTLLNKEDADIITVSRKNEIVMSRDSYIKSLSYTELWSILPDLKNYSVVHTAFARSNNETALKESLHLTQTLLEQINADECLQFINLSTQSIYGNTYPINITESYPVNPQSSYALAKLEAENLCNIALLNTKTKLFNLRLASIYNKQRFLYKMIVNALEHKEILVTAPYNIISLMDVRDVARAIKIVLTDNIILPGNYNINSHQPENLHNLAKIISLTAAKYNIHDINIIYHNAENVKNNCISPEKFNTLTGFYPNFYMSDMIDYTIQALLGKNS